MLGSTLPRSRKLLSVVAAAAFSAIMGLTLTSGAASGAGLAAPSEDTRVLDVQTNAITANPELLFVPVTPCRIVDTRTYDQRFASLTVPLLLRRRHLRASPRRAGRVVAVASPRLPRW